MPPRAASTYRGARKKAEGPSFNPLYLHVSKHIPKLMRLSHEFFYRGSKSPEEIKFETKIKGVGKPPKKNKEKQA